MTEEQLNDACGLAPNNMPEPPADFGTDESISPSRNREGDTQGSKVMSEPMKSRDWVTCPICGECDMRKESDAHGSIIHCVNLACASNGGDNYSALQVTLKFTLFSTEEKLRQSEAGAAMMRRWIWDVSKGIWPHKKGACSKPNIAQSAEEILSDSASGKSLLAKLDQSKARLVEAKWLIENASIPPVINYKEWTYRYDKWIAEGKVVLYG